MESSLFINTDFFTASVDVQPVIYVYEAVTTRRDWIERNKNTM
jgi:hypothetical protein